MGIHLGIGNKQLVNQKITKGVNNPIKFVIFDIPNKQFNGLSICPQRTPLCDRYCYVTKCQENPNQESIYEPYDNYRRCNLLQTQKDTFVEDMCREIYKLIQSLNPEKNEKIYFRIHSSGEFYSYEYFLAWTNIAERYRGNNSISFTAYTKSFSILEDYMNNMNCIPNINIILSIMYDTYFTYAAEFGGEPYGLSKTKAIIDRIAVFYNAKKYCALPKWCCVSPMIDSLTACKLGIKNPSTEENWNCGECRICYLNSNKQIYTELRKCSLLRYGRILEIYDCDMAIMWYNDCIKYDTNENDKYDAYKRLNILYKKNAEKDKQQELLNKAILNFKNVKLNDKKEKKYFDNQLRKS